MRFLGKSNVIPKVIHFVLSRIADLESFSSAVTQKYVLLWGWYHEMSKHKTAHMPKKTSTILDSIEPWWIEKEGQQLGRGTIEPWLDFYTICPQGHIYEILFLTGGYVCHEIRIHMQASVSPGTGTLRVFSGHFLSENPSPARYTTGFTPSAGSLLKMARF